MKEYRDAINCAGCGKVIWSPHPRRKYCSFECRRKHYEETVKNSPDLLERRRESWRKKERKKYLNPITLEKERARQRDKARRMRERKTNAGNS